MPPSLVEAIEAEGGLWAAGDSYTDAASVVACAHEVNAIALRLDFRDLSLLSELPQVRYLHLRSDGMPRLDPVSALTGLHALILDVSAMRGELDPAAAFPELRWLRASLGGKGGQALLAALEPGHAQLEHLSVTEVPSRTVGELLTGFPRLRHLRLHFADRLRTLGELEPAAATLRGLVLEITGLRSLEGIRSLRDLSALRIRGSEVADLEPLRTMSTLRHADLDTGPGIASLGPLRGHPGLRMLSLGLVQDGDLEPLASMPGLVAVGRTQRLVGDPPWPDVRSPAYRWEWTQALHG